jgi:carbon catabolite-derepressing protein kinase
VIEFLGVGNTEYSKPNPTENTFVGYIALEIAEKGELFDFVLNTGRFEEPVARYFFKQLISGLQSCHQAGVYHRDMKADNVFVDSDYNLKIGDFGLSSCWEKCNDDNLFTSKLGTPGYMAPEIIFGVPYYGHSVDVFASGVILFIMVV